MYKVQKKDGSLEEFDRSKIISGLKNAGTSDEEAEKVATEIENWLPTAAVDGVVNSLDIRVKGLEVLKLVNPEVASKFESFKKPSED
ncbi:MAG TPA: ATP cone domain-containing protein [Patescibacteria group bacterium]|nr:ATP cone domain-containing protein [Patescibacteria group bacterium]